MAEEGGGGVLRELIAVFGFDVDTKKLEEGENRLGEFVGRVKEFGEAIIGAFAVEKIYEFAEANVKAMSSIERASARLGVSVEEIQSYQFAAKSLGMESDSLVDSMSRLQVTQQLAAQGGKQQAAAFASLGVSLKDSNGHFKEADQLFADVADGMAKQTDASKRAALATELFGRQGRELLPILVKGSEGLDELIEQYHALGGGYSEQAIERSKEFEEQSAKLDLSLTGLRSTMLTQLLPVITLIEKAITGVVHWLSEMAKNSSIVQAALVVLGAIATVFAIKMAIAFAPVLLIAAALAGLVLIIDDLITMMKGGDSLTGEWIDKIWGKDAHLEVVQGLKEAWDGILAALKASVPVIKSMFEMLSVMVGWLDKYGEFIGDVYGKVHNAGAETFSRIQDKLNGGKGRGGLTRNERAIAESAKLYLEAEGRGEQLTPDSYLSVPKGMTRGQALTARMNMLDQMRAANYTPGASMAFGPSLPPARVSSSGASTVISQQITVHAVVPPHMATKEGAEHIAKHVAAAQKQQLRAAAASLPRATGSK